VEPPTLCAHPTLGQHLDPQALTAQAPSSGKGVGQSGLFLCVEPYRLRGLSLITIHLPRDPLVRDYRNYNRQAERSIRTARSVGVTFNCGARSLVA
jgi:hypothetical protein